MTLSETDALKILVLACPFLVVAMALFVVWLTGWMDRREKERRKVRDDAAALAEA